MKNYPALNTLSNQELLKVLIREREGDNTVHELMERHQTLPDLFVHAEIEELCQIKGVGLQKAQLIKVVYELARRLNEFDYQTLPRIKNPDDVFQMLQPELKYLQKEVFMTLILSTKNVVTYKEIVSVGTLNASLVHPREVFKTAIKKSASAVILCHNHPSGNPAHSNDDLAISKRLVEAGKIMGISVLDHIIIGGNQFISLREEGSVEF